MSNFIADQGALPSVKTDLNPLPNAANPTRYFTAADYNSIRQALIDIQTFLLGAFKLYDAGDLTKKCSLLVVTADPNGSVTAEKGSLAVDVTGGGLYQNTDGATAWSAFSGGGGGGLTQLTGDVTAGPGTGSQAATVVALQGHAVSSTAPALGTTLRWDGSQWAPAFSPVAVPAIGGPISGGVDRDLLFVGTGPGGGGGPGDGGLGGGGLGVGPVFAQSNNLKYTSDGVLRMVDVGTPAVPSPDGGLTCSNSYLKISQNGQAWHQIATYSGAGPYDGYVAYGHGYGADGCHVGPPNALSPWPLYWNEATGKLGVGTAGPSYPLDVVVAQPTDTGAAIRAAHPDNYAGIDFISESPSPVVQGGVGWGHLGVSRTHMQGVNYLYSTGPDWVIANASYNEHRFGVTEGSAFWQMRAGASAPVSEAGTARLKYNDGSGEIEVSYNGGAYAPLSSASAAIGSSVTGGTAGNLLFVGAGSVLAQDSNLVWDDTSNRLGINNTSPVSALDVFYGGYPSAVMRIKASYDSYFAGTEYINNLGSAVANLGYGNASVVLPALQNRFYVITTGAEFVVSGQGAIAAHLYNSNTSTISYQIADGASATVSDAATGKLRYNSGTSSIEVSNNGQAFSPVALLGKAQTFTKAQTVSPSALTYGANVSVDASLSNTFTLTLTGDAQLDNPTNLVDGQVIRFRVLQDGVGGHALTFDTAYDFGDGPAPDFTTMTADKLGIVTAVSDGSRLYCTYKLGYSTTGGV